MLMVKADAYGHGLENVAKFVENVVDAFGVETLDEGLRLKRAGIEKDILALALDESEILTAYENALTIGLHNVVQFDEIMNLIEQNRLNPRKLKVHVKVDCGMHRLGFDGDGLEKILPIAKNVGLQIGGVYSHLRDEGTSQKGEFERLAGIVKRCYPLAKMHLASSHSLENPQLRYDMVRLGITAYECAMKAQSRVIESRFVRAGERVSYGNCIVENDCNTAVVFGGYADGIARENPSDVWIRGVRCAVLGNVCMDCFVVNTTDYVAKIGEKVTIFDEDKINIVAKQRKTIDYAVMTSLKGRVKRMYV